MKSVGEALRLIRVYHDMSQKDVSQILGISQSFLSEIEKGNKKITLELLEEYEEPFLIKVYSIMFFAYYLNNIDTLPTNSSGIKDMGVIESKILNFIKMVILTK